MHQEVPTLVLASLPQMHPKKYPNLVNPVPQESHRLIPFPRRRRRKGQVQRRGEEAVPGVFRHAHLGRRGRGLPEVHPGQRPEAQGLRRLRRQSPQEGHRRGRLRGRGRSVRLQEGKVAGGVSRPLDEEDGEEAQPPATSGRLQEAAEEENVHLLLK